MFPLGLSAVPLSDLPEVLEQLVHPPAPCLLLLGLCMVLPKDWGERGPLHREIVNQIPMSCSVPKSEKHF